MPLLNTADAVYLGAQPVDAVYLGADKVWPADTGGFSPDDLAGLTLWLDASQTASASPWPNLGSGADPAVVGTPAPVLMPAALNGLPVIRLSANAGRYRFSGTGPDYVHQTYTLVYVGRMWGATRARLITATYPEGGNLLYGFWNGFQDVAYAGGFFTPNTQAPATTDWRLYSGDAIPALARLFSDGVFLGEYPPSMGWNGTLNISGYEAAGVAETCDCEVAEVLLYNRKLSDAERQQAEGYLREKWFGPGYDPATVAYLTATGLDQSYAPAVDALVVGLKATGLWVKMKAVYPFVGGTADLHKWNLIDPRDLDAAYRLTFNGGVHSTALGYKPNAVHDTTTFCANTHVVPLDVVDITSTHLSLYSLTTLGSYPRCDMGHYNWDGATGRFHVIAHYTSGEFYFSMGATDVPNGPGGDGSGLYVATRTGPNAQAGYRNGVLAGSSASGVYALPNTPVFIGGLNGYPREYSDMSMGFASIGAGLSAQNVTDLYTVVQAFQTALGRQVAP